MAGLELSIFISKLLPLKSLHFDCKENVENVAPILFQIRGLSRLTILRTSPEERTDETDMQRRELAVALALQTETLVDLVVDKRQARMESSSSTHTSLE